MKSSGDFGLIAVVVLGWMVIGLVYFLYREKISVFLGQLWGSPQRASVVVVVLIGIGIISFAVNFLR